MECQSEFLQDEYRIVALGKCAAAGTIPSARFRLATGLFKPTFDYFWIQNSGGCMLRWALGFFIIALVAALLGFTGISLAAAGIAKVLFYLFLILFLVTLMGHLLRRS